MSACFHRALVPHKAGFASLIRDTEDTEGIYNIWFAGRYRQIKYHRPFHGRFFTKASI